MNNSTKANLRKRKAENTTKEESRKKPKIPKTETKPKVEKPIKVKVEKPKKVKVDKPKKVKVEKAETSKSQAKLTEYTPNWNDDELLAEQLSLSIDVARNVVKLFEDGNTVPFIARYRKDVTHNMSPEELRTAKETCDEIHALKNKITTVLKTLERNHSLSDELKHSVTNSRSVEELEYVYAPYKPGSKLTLAKRAKELGLEEPALALLDNKTPIDLSNYVDPDKEELSNVGAVEKGIVHIIASVLSTDTEILSSLRELRKTSYFLVKTKKRSSKENKEGGDSRFDIYMDFEISVKYIKPHQILAINRGESLKVLSVKIIAPDSLFHNFKNLCINKRLYKGRKFDVGENLIERAIEDAYTRLVEPLIKREIRSELKQKAERASCEVFSTNLKHLLLASPLKGKYILGIDPGFANGCKLALISATGKLEDSGVVYPHRKKERDDRDVMVLKNMLLQYSCELIGLGNGTACRQTEEWLTNLIQKGVFHPLDVKYTVIREDGASIYSCSAEAKKEFPDLDQNIISAVSLARRIQDPLAELIKVEPKHLGVGMYQHDIKEKQLTEALNDVVSECVSFVGVDLNTASHCLLRHVAGLSEKRAQQIIEYRDQKGPFTCRNDLLKVSGIGPKTFQQCAGFLRVGPLNSKEALTFYKNSTASKLDSTNIHPESYQIAIQLLKKINLKLADIGEPFFINTVKEKMTLLDVENETTRHILEDLTKPLNHDFRNECPKEPIFKKHLTTIQDIRCGSVLTGVVSNVTHFGCFVDIGVGTQGLIHISKYNGLDLQIGNRVEVKVVNIEIERKRIGLDALKLL